MTEHRGEVRLRSQSLWAVGVSLWNQGESAQAAELIIQSLELKEEEPAQRRLRRRPVPGRPGLISARNGQAERAATLLGRSRRCRGPWVPRWPPIPACWSTTGSASGGPARRSARRGSRPPSPAASG